MANIAPGWRSASRESASTWKRKCSGGVKCSPALHSSGDILLAIVDAESDTCPLKAVTFIANRAASRIRPDISRAEQIRFTATGTGVLGSSLDYIQNLADKLTALCIDDRDVFSLLEEAKSFAAAQ